jgi:hypothetical protein
MYDNVGECKQQSKRLARYPGTGLEPGSVVSRGGSAARGDQEPSGAKADGSPASTPAQREGSLGRGSAFPMSSLLRGSKL